MKTAMMWVVAAILFFFGLSNLGPTKDDNTPLGLFLMFVAFAVPMFIAGKKIFKGAEARKAMFVATKALYDKALFDLQEDPENSEKYQRALVKGREYYSYLHPNTYDMNQNGVTSNHQENSGAVELKVQSDLQARTLKSKGKIS